MLSHLGLIQTSTSRATVIDLDLLRPFDLVTVSGKAVNERLLRGCLDDTQIISLKRRRNGGGSELVPPAGS